jgi:hypothetical protein
MADRTNRFPGPLGLIGNRGTARPPHEDIPDLGIYFPKLAVLTGGALRFCCAEFNLCCADLIAFRKLPTHSAEITARHRLSSVTESVVLRL